MGLCGSTLTEEDRVARQLQKDLENQFKNVSGHLSPGG
jgi:hypothetical protein